MFWETDHVHTASTTDTVIISLLKWAVFNLLLHTIFRLDFIIGTSIYRIWYCYFSVWNVSHGLLCLNTCSSLGGCWVFRKWSLAGGSSSPGAGSEVYTCFHSGLLSLSLFPCLLGCEQAAAPGHHRLTHSVLPSCHDKLWTFGSWIRIILSSLKLLLLGILF